MTDKHGIRILEFSKTCIYIQQHLRILTNSVQNILWPKTASWASMWITYSEENVIQLTKDKAGSSPLLRVASISGSPEWLRAQSWKTRYAL